MHWHILGAGAIGCLFADRFYAAGLKSCLIVRNEAQRAHLHAQQDLVRVHRDNHIHSVPVRAESAGASTAITHLLVTTKAYDSFNALQPLLPRLTPDAQIVLLQNGLGHQQRLLQQLQTQRVWAGITTSGAHRDAPFSIIPAGTGVTTLGRLDGGPATLPDGWELLSPRVQISADIQHTLWQKLAVNAAINPLTALHGCRNGDLLVRPELKTRLHALCTEIERVAQAAGFNPLFETPLYEVVDQVATTTADNLSSMLQDVRAGRTTEVEQITGYLCEEAARLGVATPLNSALLDAMRHITNTSE